MNLCKKSIAVMELFAELEIETRSFINDSQLGCISGCGFCCSNPKISATVLEFIPLAFDLYEKGKAEKALEVLEQKTENDFCILYKSLSEDGEKGYCSDYTNRGMICRLFGSSSRRNKHGQKEIITCKKIKSQKQEDFEKASQSIKQDLPIPSASGFYEQLAEIDHHLGTEQYPINQAIKNAIEKVLTYKFYENMESSESPESF